MLKSNKKIILPPDFYQLLHNKHLLLDTSFFGDYSSYPELFGSFVEESKSKHITFITCLPVTSSVLNVEVPLLVEKYGQIGKSVSITDFILAAQTKLHPRDLCLLTKNPKDFPSSIFSIKTNLLLQIERGLQVYGVYCYENEVKENADPLLLSSADR